MDFKYYSELKTIFIKFKEYQLIKNAIFFFVYWNKRYVWYSTERTNKKYSIL